MSTKFVVYTNTRSGSSWLIDTLDQTPSISAYPELFTPKQQNSSLNQFEDKSDTTRFIASRPTLPKPRPRAVTQYLNTFYAQNTTIGFKLLHNQLRRFPEIFLYFKINKIKVIHLLRKNHLDRIISKQIKDIRNKSWQTENEDTFNETIELNPTFLIKKIKSFEKAYRNQNRLLTYLNLQHINIYYEDLIKTPQSFLPIWNFLNLPQPSQIPQSRFQKIVKKPHQDLINNYHQIKQTLQQTGYDHLLHHP